MKAILTLFVFIYSLNSFAQTCEEQIEINVKMGKDYCEGLNGCGVSGYTTRFALESKVSPSGTPYVDMACYFTSCTSGDIGGGQFSGYTYCGDANSTALSPKLPSHPFCKSGSIIHVESQIVGESVSLVGIGFSMNYFTSWSHGRSGAYKITVPIAGATPRDNITSFDVETKFSGSTVHSANFVNNAANVTYNYVWDGKDSSGNLLLGSRQYEVIVTEHRPTIDMPTVSIVSLGGLKSAVLGLGGWLPSIYNFYDVSSSTLYKGDGSTRYIKAMSWNTTGFSIAEEDASVVYYFDSTGRHVFTKSGLLGTNLYTFNYNGSGQLISIDEPFGRTTTFNRNLGGDFVSITGPKGQVTSVNLDVNGFVSSFTNPNNEVYSMTYHGTKGLLATFTKPAGQISTYTYDAEGNLIQDDHSGGYFFDFVKNLNAGYQSSVAITSKMGRVTTVQSNFDSNVTNSTQTMPNSSQETYNYTSYAGGATQNSTSNGIGISYSFVDDSRYGAGVHFPSSKVIQYGSVYRSTSSAQSIVLSDPTDPFSILSFSVSSVTGNLSITSQYNPSPKTFDTSTNLGRTWQTEIDSYERTVSQKQGNLYSVDFTYTNENLTKIKQNTRETTLAYNPTTGFLSSITNPLSQTTGFTYDAAGRVSSKIFPDLRAVTYSYDANGNVSGITPPGRTIHSFNLNASEMPGSYAPPTLSGVPTVNTIYSYNDDKQLTQILKPTGDSIDLAYDATTGVLQTVDVPGNTFTYTMNTTNGLPYYITSTTGPVTMMTYAGTLPVQYTTYANGWSVYISDYTASLSSNGTVGSDAVSAASSSSITYTYNDDEMLTGAGDLTLSYSFPNGQLTGTAIGTSPNDVTDEYTYNSFGEVTNYKAKYGSTTIYDLTLGHDASGRINGKTQVMNSTTDVYDYTFDVSGRITQMDKNSTTVATYGYDDNSNRNSGSIGGTPTTATYDAQDRMSAYNLLTFTYNANGDLTSKTNTLLSTTTDYTYDVFGNLTSVTLPSTTVIDYEVDGLNRRIGKSIGGALQKRWVYMDQTRIAAELDSSGNITKRFVWGSKGNVPDYMIMGGDNYRIVSDHLGSPRLVVKVSDGSVLGRMDHDEFGRVTVDTNPGLLPFGFAGGLYDTDTGLVRFGARDYDPETGRWTSKDPILFGGGDANLFGYISNDPINWIDPSGLAKCTYSITSGRLSCTSNDGGSSGSANMFSGNNDPNSTGNKYGPIPMGKYDLTKIPGANDRDWFIDPGLLSRIGYRLNANRGGFNLHLRKGGSDGCITGSRGENDNNFRNINNILNQDAGSNTIEVGF